MTNPNQKWADLFGAEFTYIVKIGSCLTDPEEKKAFWDMCKAKKLADPCWSIYESFPTSKDHKSVAKKYGDEILELLRSHARHEEEKPVTSESEEQKELRNMFSELIEVGGHHTEMCAWPRRIA